MKNKKNSTRKIVLIGLLAILIVIAAAIGLSYAFMKPVVSTESVTTVTLNSCARISLTNTSSSIALSGNNGGYPMSKQKALQNTPYSFTVNNSCTTTSNYSIYLGTLSSNTLTAENNIYYIITTKGTKNIIQEGKILNTLNRFNSFTAEEKTQFNSGTGGTVNAIYELYSSSLATNTSAEYDLYLFIDPEVSDSSTMNKTFTSGLAVKATN